MYLPSKTKHRFIVLILLAVFLFFLPFKSAIKDLLVFFSKQFRYTSQNFSQEIEKLKKENLSLELKVKEFNHLREENQILRNALNFKADKDFDLLGVDVIAFSPSSWDRFVLVNAGEDEGLEKGMFIVDEDGNLVGKVAEVDKNSSRVILVNDPNFNLSVFIGKEGFGLLEGNLIGAKLLYIEDTDKISEGDKIWIKLPSLSSSIEIGQVKSAKRSSNNLFWDVDAKLYLKSSFFDKLFVVK